MSYNRKSYLKWFANLSDEEKEMRLLRMRARHYLNKEFENSRRRKHYYDHRDAQLKRSLDRQRRLWNTPKEKARRKANKVRRRNRISSTIETLTSHQWNSIKLAWNHRCAYCRKRKPLTQDHVIPVSKGGTHTMDNVIPACLQCNQRKSAKSYDQYLDEMCNRYTPNNKG